MIKKLLTVAVLLVLITSVNAQVFNTASVLKQKKLSLGVEPTIIAEGDNDFILFGHAGLGIAKGIDLGVKLGVFGPGEEYIGADIEFAFHKNFSISGGAHSSGNFGLDGTFLGTIEAGKNIDIYGGADLDINFADKDGDGNDEALFLLWVPVGVEVFIKKKLAFILEGSIAATDDAYNIIGGGVSYYF